MTNILIIDDERAFTNILKKRLLSFLSSAEFEIVYNLTDAKKLLESNKTKYDLVFIDEHLSDGRGNEFIKSGIFGSNAVISMSSDESPEVPGATLKAGAQYFLSKTQISTPLFAPLVIGLIERNQANHELQQSKLNAVRIETIKTLIATLKHEINNPLGVVLGSAFMLKNSSSLAPDQIEAIELLEKSGNRISEVINELEKALNLIETKKGNQKVFHLASDKQWE